jgi:hypothetical protein
MSLGPDGFVILFLSTLLPFSGTVHLSVNQALSIDKETKKPFPLAPQVVNARRSEQILPSNVSSCPQS